MMTEPSPKESQQLQLPDGRRLGFAEYGDPAGVPFFYFHGWPSSRFEARAVHAPALSLGVRLVAPERPGYGLSDFQPGRTIAGWTKDLLVLAGQLGWSRFGVVGVSGGGPYAIACAALLPERLESVTLVCSAGPCDAPGVLDGMAPMTRWLLTFARTTPWLAQKSAAMCLRALWGKGHQVIPRQIEEALPPADKKALENPDLRAALVASSTEGLRCGMEGAAWDGLLLAGSWGLELESIQIPIRLWHGEKDIVVPVAMGRHLAGLIRNCRATFYPEDGHFSLPYGRVQEIFQAALKTA